MRKQIGRLSAVILAFAAIWSTPSMLSAGISNGSADIVLGQMDFTHNGRNLLTAKGLDDPEGVAIDKSDGRVYVCDTVNDRVLWWNSSTALTNGQQADGVIGQTDLLSNTNGCSQTQMDGPIGISVDSSGNIWIADYNNNRVLKFTRPTTNGQPASLVLGQPDFTSNGIALSQTGFSSPVAVFVDSSGNVWVVDTDNSRVLKFSNPTANGQAASLVLGQLDFTSKSNSFSQTVMGYPSSIAVDSSGNVWVEESWPSRVLRFSNPSTNGQAADIVLGQVDFNSYASSCSKTGLSCPEGLCLDNSGNVWVADSNNYRVLKYSSPISSGMAASMVLGQANFDSSEVDCSQTGMDFPKGLTFDASGNIWIADSCNNRVSRFTNPSVNGQAAGLVLGQNDFDHWGENITKDNGVYAPEGIVTDPTSGRVYVSDSENNRILWWNNSAALSDGQQADGVLGQKDLVSHESSCSQSGLNMPYGISLDSSGNLWVADLRNNRVLKFAKPTTNGQTASLVLGQTDFVSKIGTCTQSGMGSPWWNGPASVAVDGSGNVWVADYPNNRVLKFTNPTTNGQPASLVLGQSDFVSNVATCTQTGMGRTSYGGGPWQLAVDNSGNIWVTESCNCRVLKYTNPSTNGQAASLVLGQADFNSNSPGISQTGMSVPCAVSVDSSGNAWISDNHRVLEYSSPANNGQAASFVIGQKDFTTNAPACTKTGIDWSNALHFDTAGNLWLADGGNNRVLKYKVIHQTQIDKTKDVTLTFVTDYGDLTIFIPAGAFSDNVILTITVTRVPDCNDPCIKLSGVGIEITNNLGLQPMKDIKLTLSYRSQDITGLIEAKLVLAYYDTVLSKWNLISSTADTLVKQVTGYVRHFSKFAIVQASAAADLNSVKVYPNPFNFRTAPGGMTIANLTASATIKIYNVAGELIKTVSYTSANGQTSWNGKNDSSSMVASGVYIMYINAPEGTKKLKVAVEK